MFFDVESIVQTGGLLAIILIIFAETGLLLGFFLPGDTLLIAAGILASQDKLPLIPLLILTTLAAIIGYQTGYIIGERAGPRLFKRKDGLFFREEYIERTQELTQKHGAKAILLARFIVVVRTIVPLVAGIGNMSKKRFFYYNVLGGILWVASLVLASYWLGHQVPDLDKYLLPLIVIAMILTTGGGLIEIARTKQRRQALKNALRDEWDYFFKDRKPKK